MMLWSVLASTHTSWLSGTSRNGLGAFAQGGGLREEDGAGALKVPDVDEALGDGGSDGAAEEGCLLHGRGSAGDTATRWRLLWGKGARQPEPHSLFKARVPALRTFLLLGLRPVQFYIALTNAILRKHTHTLKQREAHI